MPSLPPSHDPNHLSINFVPSSSVLFFSFLISPLNFGRSHSLCLLFFFLLDFIAFIHNSDEYKNALCMESSMLKVKRKCVVTDVIAQ